MQADAVKAEFEIGQPVIFGDMANPDKTGWIAAIEAKPSDMKVYTLGGGAMEREHFDIVIAWENLTHSEVSEGIARPWAEKALRYQAEAKDPADVAALLDEAKAAEQKRRDQRAAEAEAHMQQVSDWRDSIRAKVPADAKAVLVAELVQDQSDSQTDYFGSSTTKTVILGFSRHTRDLFPEMRKAAACYEATAHLTDAPEDAEHREKYSMGGGYYLKDGYRHNSGWKVSKQTFYARGNDIAEAVPYLAQVDAFAKWLAPFRKTDWVVYAKPPFGGPEQVLAYLSRYTHRVAISNHRLVSADANTVAFRWKDYRIKRGDRQKVMRLATPEFIRRSLIHVLPDGFHRIRHYGLLASSARKTNIAKIRALLGVQSPDQTAEPEQVPETTPLILREPCPCCGGDMRIIEIFRRGQRPMSRAPPREQAA